jgi:hypothetical protein
MPEQSWTGAEVRFIDYDQVLADLRRAVAEAKTAHPEIVKVYLFGSLVQGNWTADSDADLIVIVRRDFADIFARGDYHISAPSIPTDTVVYSESEFAKLAQDPSSFLAQNLPSAMEL